MSGTWCDRAGDSRDPAPAPPALAAWSCPAVLPVVNRAAIKAAVPWRCASLPVVFAMAMGLPLFHGTLALSVPAGSAIIIAAGLFALLQERKTP